MKKLFKLRSGMGIKDVLSAMESMRKFMYSGVLVTNVNTLPGCVEVSYEQNSSVMASPK